MPKAKKRKQPIFTVDSNASTSVAARECRNAIRQYHALLKRRRQLEKFPLEHKQSLDQLEKQINALGGIERYQQLSLLGQRGERGGGSEKIFIQWMKELNLHRIPDRRRKLQLLEVGALKPDNYQSACSWIEWIPIDLRSRHPRIVEQDFLLLDYNEHHHKWDAISLSLVLNFVSVPADRGHILQLAHKFLVPDGLLFLVLPLPCVANSRYLTFDSLKSLMESVGFVEKQQRWRQNGKMCYWLYQKSLPSPKKGSELFNKKTVLRQGQRNNFAIILESPATRS